MIDLTKSFEHLARRAAKHTDLALYGREGRTAGSTEQVTMATGVVMSLLGGLQGYDRVKDQVDIDRPKGSLAQYAGEYAATRAALDRAVADDDQAKLPGLILEATARADEMAIRLAENPTSRIRPAFDRRPVSNAPSRADGMSAMQRRGDDHGFPTKKVKKLLNAVLRRPTDWAELDKGAKWDLAQRIMHAKIDFQQWRLREGLIATDQIDVRVDVVLSTRVAPDVLNTDGHDIELPPDVEDIHYYVQSGRPDVKGDRYAHVGYVTTYNPNTEVPSG